MSHLYIMSYHTLSFSAHTLTPSPPLQCSCIFKTWWMAYFDQLQCYGVPIVYIRSIGKVMCAVYPSVIHLTAITSMPTIFHTGTKILAEILVFLILYMPFLNYQIYQPVSAERVRRSPNPRDSDIATILKYL